MPLALKERERSANVCGVSRRRRRRGERVIGDHAIGQAVSTILEQLFFFFHFI